MEEERPESDVVIQDAIMQDVENSSNSFFFLRIFNYLCFPLGIS